MHLLRLHDGAACVPTACALVSYTLHVLRTPQVAGKEEQAPEQIQTFQATCKARHSWLFQAGITCCITICGDVDISLLMQM